MYFSSSTQQNPVVFVFNMKIISYVIMTYTSYVCKSAVQWSQQQAELNVTLEGIWFNTVMRCMNVQ